MVETGWFSCCIIVWFFSWREVSSFHGRTFAAWLEPGQQNRVKLHKTRGGCLNSGLRSRLCCVITGVDQGRWAGAERGRSEGLTTVLVKAPRSCWLIAPLISRERSTHVVALQLWHAPDKA